MSAGRQVFDATVNAIAAGAGYSIQKLKDMSRDAKIAAGNDSSICVLHQQHVQVQWTPLYHLSGSLKQ
jgi:hypothetical protein